MVLYYTTILLYYYTTILLFYYTAILLYTLLYLSLSMGIVIHRESEYNIQGATYVVSTTVLYYRWVPSSKEGLLRDTTRATTGLLPRQVTRQVTRDE